MLPKQKLGLALMMLGTLALASCATAPGTAPTVTLPTVTLPTVTPTVDPSTVDQVQSLAVKVCGYLPAAETVAGVVASLVGYGTIVSIVSAAADGICKAVTAKGARRHGARPHYRGVLIRGSFVHR